MNKITGSTFKNQKVTLDDHHYDGCDFQSCRLVYAASGGLHMTNNRISADCVFEFTGAAANTVAAMRGIYAMGDLGRKTILATFQEVAPDLKNLH